MTEPSFISDTLRLLRTWIGERGVADTLRERLLLVAARLELAEQVVRTQSGRIADLEQQLEQTREQLARGRKAEEYVEYRAALWRRVRRDGRETLYDTPHCPSCRQPMAEFPAGEHFPCRPCRRHTGFTGGDLARVHSAAVAQWCAG